MEILTLKRIAGRAAERLREEFGKDWYGDVDGDASPADPGCGQTGETITVTATADESLAPTEGFHAD